MVVFRILIVATYFISILGFACKARHLPQNVRSTSSDSSSSLDRRHVLDKKLPKRNEDLVSERSQYFKTIKTFGSALLVVSSLVGSKVAIAAESDDKSYTDKKNGMYLYLYLYMYVYSHTYTNIYIYIYIYIYIEFSHNHQTVDSAHFSIKYIAN
jgi:hypothetical protein